MIKTLGRIRYEVGSGVLFVEPRRRGAFLFQYFLLVFSMVLFVVLIICVSGFDDPMALAFIPFLAFGVIGVFLMATELWAREIFFCRKDDGSIIVSDAIGGIRRRIVEAESAIISMKERHLLNALELDRREWQSLYWGPGKPRIEIEGGGKVFNFGYSLSDEEVYFALQCIQEILEGFRSKCRVVAVEET